MTLPLEGLKVVDLTQMLAGPGTGMYLADLGADVIKVERPGGEDARQSGTTPFLGKESKTFMVLNRNKRGIVVDLTQEAGRQVVYRLAERSDVFLESFVPGVAEKLGVGYDRISQINPRIIYASISGFGTKGPYATRPAYDLILQGLSGIMASRRTPQGVPIAAALWVSDCSAPMLLAYGIMAGLWAREHTGRGQKVETSLLQAAIAMQSTTLVQVPADPTQGPDPAQATYQPYLCQDGEYINVVILNERQWQNFCRVLELEHLATDERYNSVWKRAQRRQELFPLLEGLFSLRPSEEWLRHLQEVGIPCGPIISREQVFSEPQVLANEMLTQVEHPAVGKTQMLGLPLKFSKTPGKIRRPAPTVGQHTQEVLRELGYSDQEIEELRQTGVVEG